MTSAERRNMLIMAKRAFLLVTLCFIGLVTMTCVALMVFLSDANDAIEWTVPSAILLAYMLALGMGAFSALEKGRWRILAAAGVVLAALTCLTSIAWFGFEAYLQETYGYGAAQEYSRARQTHWTLMVLASWTCLMTVAGIPRLNLIGKFLQACTALMLTGSAVFILLAVWEVVEGRSFERVLFGFPLVSVAGLGAIFVVSRFMASTPADELTDAVGSLHVRCPRCQTEQMLPTGDSRCGHCRMKFHITLEEPRCGGCGYLLRGLTSAVCPECGMAVPRADMPAGGGAIAASGSAAAATSPSPGGSA